MFHRLSWPLLVAFALFAPGKFLAQKQIGGIGGQIRLAGGEFVPHQVVVDLQFRGSTINSAYTDTQGRFAFAELESEVYHVIINDDAYYPVDEIVNLRPESPYANLQIFVRPRETKKKEDPLGSRAIGGNPYLVDPADYNKRFPGKVIKEYEKGIEAERKERPEDAIAHYLAALNFAPDYYPAHNNLGALYLAKSDFKSAEEQFQSAIRLDPNEAQAYLNLANVFLITSRFRESEDALTTGLQRRPDSAFGYFLQGSLYEQTERLPQAETSLHRAITLDPAMWQAHLRIATLYIRENRRDDAIGQLQSFILKFPSAPSAAKAKVILEKLLADQKSGVASTH